MSIYTDMKTVSIMINEPIDGLSGAKTDKYVLLKDISMAIYKNDGFKNINTVKYQESTHNAITFYKGFEDDREYQVIVDSKKYQVKDFNTSGRQTTLLLKRLDFYGK